MNAVARDYLRGFFKELQQAGLIEDVKKEDAAKSDHDHEHDEQRDEDAAKDESAKEELQSLATKLETKLDGLENEKGEHPKEKGSAHLCVKSTWQKHWYKGLTEHDFI